MALKQWMVKGTEQAEEASEPAARVRQTKSPPTCIDAETELSGKLRCVDSLRIEGRVKGEVHCERTVEVGASARVDAQISAETIVISGEVTGDIVAGSRITLEKTARVTGDMRTPGIVIEEGAKLEGRIVIGSDEKSEAARKPAAPSKTRENGRAKPETPAVRPTA